MKIRFLDTVTGIAIYQIYSSVRKLSKCAWCYIPTFYRLKRYASPYMPLYIACCENCANDDIKEHEFYGWEVKIL